MTPLILSLENIHTQIQDKNNLYSYHWVLITVNIFAVFFKGTFIHSIFITYHHGIYFIFRIHYQYLWFQLTVFLNGFNDWIVKNYIIYLIHSSLLHICFEICLLQEATITFLFQLFNQIHKNLHSQNLRSCSPAYMVCWQFSSNKSYKNFFNKNYILIININIGFFFT